MTAATFTTPIHLEATTRADGPGRRFDPFGIVSGFRAYRIYTDLAALSDVLLSSVGLERGSIARVTAERAFGRA
jgi:hypothetical protein